MKVYDTLRKKNKDKLDRLNLKSGDSSQKILIWEICQPRDIKDVIEFTPVFPGTFKKIDAHGTYVAQVIRTVAGDSVEFYATNTMNPAVIDFCITNDIRIINASISIVGTSGIEEQLKRYADWGGIVVAAAGNISGRNIRYPARSEYAISVSATNVEDCDGEKIDVTADSLWWVRYANGQYDTFNGTSCAAPVIAGCVARILDVFPYWKLMDVKRFLRENSVPGDEPYEKIFSFPDNWERSNAMKDIEGHWAEKEIKDVISKNIMIGNPDGKFRPDDNITRAELAVVISRLWGSVNNELD